MNYTEDQQKAMEAVGKARTYLVIKQPFFASLALGLRVVLDETIDTMATDGRRLAYNSKFVLKLKQDELVGVVAHEAMHVGLAHHARMGHRQLRPWNHAADYAINQLLVDAGFKLPKDALLDEQFKGMSAEEIYEKFPTITLKIPGMGGKGDKGDGNEKGGVGGCGYFEPPTDPETGKPLSGAEMSQMEAEARVAFHQAAHAAKRQGLLPGSIERMIGEWTEQRVDWETRLRRFMTEKCRSDYSWSPPNRRFASRGIYLPSLQSESAIGEIVVAVDTSGSIGEEQLNQFGAEIRAIVSDVKPSQTVIIYCDAAIGRVDTFEPGKPVTLNPVGGGGTDFRPPFDYVSKHLKNPACFIYLTDMMGPFPSQPDYPVMWATYGAGGAKGPFGETIEID